MKPNERYFAFKEELSHEKFPESKLFKCNPKRFLITSSIILYMP